MLVAVDYLCCGFSVSSKHAWISSKFLSFHRSVLFYILVSHFLLRLSTFTAVLFLLCRSEWVESPLQLPTSIFFFFFAHPSLLHICAFFHSHMKPHSKRPKAWYKAEAKVTQTVHLFTIKTWIYINDVYFYCCMCVQLASLSWFGAFPVLGNNQWSRWVKTSWGPSPTSKTEPASSRWVSQQVGYPPPHNGKKNLIW